jgi:alkanesulfonate monooxygenase SsuD/methylene tetrahydromethanopterin reductase-like flavin-dependent oxidoreductase (luciferase family)
MLGAAVEADRAGLSELWLWEDCFLEGGLTSAAAILSATDRVVVGIGLLPMPLRNVAITAMEIATLERMFPGRLRVAVGHGVQPWMEQVGAKARSPLGLAREYLVALRRLLAGEEVTVDGNYVTLDAVRLGWPPLTRVPVLLGAIGPKSLALAGECADGSLSTPTSRSTAHVRPSQPASRASRRRHRRRLRDLRTSASTAGPMRRPNLARRDPAA